MRKIGIMSGAYTDDLAKYAKMANDGFEAVDFQTFVNTEDKLFEGSVTDFETKLKAEKKAADDAGISIYQTHGPWRWPVHDSTPEERAERMEKMKLSLYGTAVLGCKYMALHPIMPFGPEMPEPTNHAKFYEMNREFYSELIKEAEKDDVVICFENMPMFHLPTASPTKTAEFIRSFESEHFKMCLDTGHGFMLREEPGYSVRNCKDIIKILHVHDNDSHGDYHWLPYKGRINWADFTDSLSELDEDVVLLLECGIPKKMPEAALDSCRKSLARVALTLAGR